VTTRVGIWVPLSTAVAIALMAGCSRVACTLIGAEPGIQVTVDESLRGPLSGGKMIICVNGGCQTQQLPYRDMTPIQTCGGTGCADPSAVVEDLAIAGRPADVPKDSATVKVVGFNAAGNVVASGTTKVRTSTFSPNGPDCAPRVAVLRVNLSPSGVSTVS